MKADLMKMPHHGTESLAPNSFFDRVDPKFVLVPGSVRIWCGELGARPRKWVEGKGIPTWVSGNSGHVRVDFHKYQTVITPQFNLTEEGSPYEIYVQLNSDLAMSYQATNGGKTMEEWGRWHWETYGQHDEGRELLEASPYEHYVREQPDLLKAYRLENTEKTIGEWGRSHWDTYGQYETGRLPPITSRYEHYVRQYSDLLTIYRATNHGKTMEEWGRWHWEVYGQYENERMPPALMECKGKAFGQTEWKD